LWKEWQFYSTVGGIEKMNVSLGKIVPCYEETLVESLSRGKSGGSTPPVGGIEKSNLSQGKTL
jgi:hypothetical protein